MADTFKSVMAKFAGFGAIVHPVLNKEIKLCAVKVRDTATKKFGNLQPAVGPYPAWPLLTIDTVKEKARAGAPGLYADPLIGHYQGKTANKVWPAPLRTTIEIDVEGWVATVGSRDPLAKWHEYGATEAGKNHNVTIPPRPFLRPALFENTDHIHKQLTLALGATIKKM
jgi:phage gpG-like protein